MAGGALVVVYALLFTDGGNESTPAMLTPSSQVTDLLWFSVFRVC